MSEQVTQRNICFGRSRKQIGIVRINRLKGSDMKRTIFYIFIFCLTGVFVFLMGSYIVQTRPTEEQRQARRDRYSAMMEKLSEYCVMYAEEGYGLYSRRDYTMIDFYDEQQMKLLAMNPQKIERFIKQFERNQIKAEKLAIEREVERQDASSYNARREVEESHKQYIASIKVQAHSNIWWRRNKAAQEKAARREEAARTNRLQDGNVKNRLADYEEWKKMREPNEGSRK